MRILFGKYLPQFGIHTDLVTATAGDAPDWGGGKLFARRFRSKIGWVLADVAQQLTLFRRCFQGYDGLIVRDKPFLGLVGLCAARFAGIPFVYWMSFPMPEADLAIARTADGTVGPLKRLYKWIRGQAGSIALYRFIAPRANHVFVQSPVMLAHLKDRCPGHAPATPVPMGVDMAALPATTTADPNQAPDRRIAVYLGTLSLLRRHELGLMVDAAALVRQVLPDFELLVIGDSETPSEQGWLRRYAEARGIADAVRCTGWVPYAEGLQLASAASVGVSPIPRGELFDMGCPTKAIEYMALGLPVVCNDQPDQAEVIGASGGGLCVSLTAEAFATAIVRLLQEPGHARRMGEAGRDWVATNRDYKELAAGVARTLRVLRAEETIVA